MPPSCRERGAEVALLAGWLKDGRVCLTYGHRTKPFGIRARLGGKDGRSWSEEIVLRDDGVAGTWVTHGRLSGRMGKW